MGFAFSTKDPASMDIMDKLLAFLPLKSLQVAVMPNAKSFFPEDHPNYIGIFWVNISTPYCGETASGHHQQQQ